MCVQCEWPGCDPWLAKIPRRRERLPTSVFWPGEFHVSIMMGSQRVGHNWATFTFIFSFYPWVRKIPWKRKWQPTPVLLPGKSHGWRSLAGYSPWGQKELDMAEWLTLPLGNTCIGLEWNLKAWPNLLEWSPPHCVHPEENHLTSLNLHELIWKCDALKK